ncbi:MAG: hypothetical protein HN407_05580 [Chloroflexi bacterium]|jgi:predicted transcriptional regulator|nr:hypothetical protein [Chloroflexota bacterium]
MPDRILGTTRSESIRKRFQIAAAMLGGKRDILSVGSHETGIISEVELSASSIRRFLSYLTEEGYVSLDYISAWRAPHAAWWPNHIEYTFTETGKRFLETELKAWSESQKYDYMLGERVRALLIT